MGTQNSKIRYGAALLDTIPGGVITDPTTKEVTSYQWALLPEGTMTKVETTTKFFLSKEERNGLCGWPNSDVKKVWLKEMDPPEEWIAAEKWVQSQEERDEVEFVKQVTNSNASHQ